MTRENIIEKIKKLLALSKSDNPNEAYLAMTRAQELQAKYNVTVAEVEERSEDVIDVKDMPTDTKTANSQFILLASALAEHFRVRVYRSTRGYLGIVGLAQDVTVFQEVFHFMYEALRNTATKYVKSLPNTMSRSEKTANKNTYVRGFISGASEALTLNETEHALVVVAPQTVVKYMKEKCSGTWTSQVKCSRSSEAYNHGHADGMAVARNRNKQVTA